jgi:hypothetical protein
MGSERPLCGHACRYGVAGLAEGDEERLAFGADLAPLYWAKAAPSSHRCSARTST